MYEIKCPHDGEPIRIPESVVVSIVEEFLNRSYHSNQTKPPFLGEQAT